MFFKRKERQYCKHEWELLDFDSYVDIGFDICDRYKIGCPKCLTIRTIDEYTYEKMCSQGLINK